MGSAEGGGPSEEIDAMTRAFILPGNNAVVIDDHEPSRSRLRRARSPVRDEGDDDDRCPICRQRHRGRRGALMR